MVLVEMCLSHILEVGLMGYGKWTKYCRLGRRRSQYCLSFLSLSVVWMMVAFSRMGKNKSGIGFAER